MAARMHWAGAMPSRMTGEELTAMRGGPTAMREGIAPLEALREDVTDLGEALDRAARRERRLRRERDAALAQAREWQAQCREERTRREHLQRRLAEAQARMRAALLRGLGAAASLDCMDSLAEAGHG